jgi:flavin-dependent dehydrogenase
LNAQLVVDATGRSRVLAGSLAKGLASRPQERFVGFKAHLRGVDSPTGVCEIYAFRGGYAGLSHIENGLANLCFLAKASVLKDHADPDKIVEYLRSINDRAADTLDSASRIEEWHAVSVPRFGEYGTPHKTGLVTVGDSTAFVDPFTGSGMLMAIESARLLADIISRYGMDRERINTLYPDAYRKLFSSRLKTSGIIRAVAYEPLFSTAAVRLLSCSERLRILLTRRTRSPRL